MDFNKETHGLRIVNRREREIKKMLGVKNAKEFKIETRSGSRKSWLQEFYRVQDCVNIQF